MAQQQSNQQSNNQGKTVTTTEWVSNIQSMLMKQIEEKIKALPPGFNKDRFILNCITLIRDMLKDNKKKENLQKVTPESIVLCLMKGAFLGLDFLNGECYAIPYGGEMKFQTDYKGEIKVCKKHSIEPIKDIYAKLVREGDSYEEKVEDGHQKITFVPIPFSNSQIVGSFAIVLYQDGSMAYESMSKDEIEYIRENYSKAKDSDAWKKSAGEMYKKTVIRRLSKGIEKDFDNEEQLLAYDEGGGVEFENGLLSTSRKNPVALPDKGEPDNPFNKMQRSRGKEPIPVQNQKEEEEFARFEQMYDQERVYGHNEPPYDPGFAIPDEDPELPWR